MAALGLRHWLSRTKRRNAGPAGPAEERRIKRWCYRPVIEQLEARLVVGSLLVRPIVPDGYWLDDGLGRSSLGTDQADPLVKAITQSQSPLELHASFRQGRPFGGSLTGASVVRSSLRDQARLGTVMPEKAGLRLLHIWNLLQKCLHDSSVQNATSGAQKAFVSGVLNQSMLEDVDGIGRDATAEGQFGSEELIDPLQEGRFGQLCDGGKHLVRKLPPDDRADLRHLFRSRKAIESGHQ